jgi:hypothetical protein
MLIYFMAIWIILWIFGIFYDQSVHFLPFGTSSSFGIMHQEKSGNPATSRYVHKVLSSLETWPYPEATPKSWR